MPTRRAPRAPLDRRARADDLVAGTSHEFVGALDEFVAATLDDVVATVAAAEAAAARGRWVVGYVAYEAGRAFDRAFPDRSPPVGLPYAQFVVFGDREPIEPLDRTIRGGNHQWNHELVGLRRSPAAAGYEADVEAIRRRIELGDAYQVNLTSRFHAQLDGDPASLYASMARAQRGAYNIFLEFGDLVVISASPELFFEWDGTTITTRPMKGTIPRGARLAEDADAAATLRTSAKDRAENVMIVDLLRNDLSRLAEVGSVRVPALFDLERYETVWQLTSTVQATTRPGTDLAAILGATFPCGSITGAPKASAMSIIDGLEPEPRGVYCGAIGMLAPPDAGIRARFSVAIRTAIVDRPSGRFVYGSGGGITWSSDPASESAEADAKARVLTERRPSFRLLETIRLDVGGPGDLTAHLDRLEASAEWFGFACDRAAIDREIRLLPRPNLQQRLRILLARDGTTSLSVTALGAEPATSISLAIDTERLRSDDTFCRHKTSNRAHYEAARGRHPEADDVVLVNERGEVMETTIANLLYRLGSRWYTPALSSGGLNGIGRQGLLDAGEITERVLWLDELRSCDELRVVSSLRGQRLAHLIGSPHKPASTRQPTSPLSVP